MPQATYESKRGSAIESAVGGLTASVFSAVYILAPLWIIAAVVGLVWMPSALATRILVIPLAVSILIPPMPAKWLLQQWPLQCIPKYFQYREVLEIDDAALEQVMNSRAHIFTAVPHGVISYVGICSAIVRASWHLYEALPTAAATVLLRFPFMKNVLGVFGLVDASRDSLQKRLSGGGHVVLYLGGIAELFLSSPTSEAVYLKKRAGFIKLALQTGADVVPLYLFGNTSVLSVVSTGPLAALSRKLQMSFTLFWGRWGLPVPRPRPLLYVRGKPLGLPVVAPEKITDELVAEWHGKFLREVERLYSTYRELNVDYKDKPLEVQ